MNAQRPLAAVILFLAFTVATWTCAQDTGRALTEQDLVKLLDLQIDEDTIVGKVSKGIGFAVDEAALKRLEQAGASETLLQAVQQAAKAKPAPGGKAITFQDITKLLELGIDEPIILKRLEKSPTVFILDADQIAELKKAGASDKLIAALQRERQLSSQAAELITDFAIVLDCSGSMKELTPEGEMKMTTAKRVVTEMVQKIPDGLNVTFIIYGHEVFGGADDPRNCQAVKIARPLSMLDAAGKSELSSLIAGLKPTGATPIALSLKTAGEELAKNDAFCGLVLITDGLETCKGDPEAEAAALVSKLKLSFGINVVSFGVKPEESGALKGIADAGNGKYYNAASAAELTDALQQLSKDLEKVAPEPPQINVVASAVSAIVVSPLTVEGFPSIEDVYVTKPDSDPNSPVFMQSGYVQSQKTLGKPMLVPPGEYNIVYKPKGAEYLVTLVKNIKVQARQTVKINTNRAAAAVLVKDPKIDGVEMAQLYASVPGENPNGPVYVYSIRQSSDKFGQVMMVNAGEKYDIVLKPKEGQNVTIFEGIEPKGGQLTVVGGEEEPEIK